MSETTTEESRESSSQVENFEQTEQRKEIKNGVVSVLERKFSKDVINDYLMKHSPGERKELQGKLIIDLAELAAKLKETAMAGDLNLENAQATDAVICEFLRSKRLSSLERIVKGEVEGLVDESFIKKIEEVELETEKVEVQKKDNKKGIENKKVEIQEENFGEDFFQLHKIDPNEIYVSEDGKKHMKIVSYENGRVHIAFLPSGTMVEEGVNVINLDADWKSGSDDEIMDGKEFLELFKNFKRVEEGSGDGSKEELSFKEIDSMEVSALEKKNGEVLSLKDMMNIFGVVGSVHKSKDGIKKLKITKYLYEKAQNRWEIQVEGTDIGGEKIMSPDKLEELINEEYPEIEVIPEVEAGGMRAEDFVAEFGKSKEFVFKSNQGGLKPFVIEKDKFSQQSKQHQARILIAGEKEGRYVSVKELRQMILNGGYRKESNVDGVFDSGNEKKVQNNWPKEKLGINEEAPSTESAIGSEIKNELKKEVKIKEGPGETTTEKALRAQGTHFREWMDKTEGEKIIDNQERGKRLKKQGTHFQEWMDRTDDFGRKDEENMGGQEEKYKQEENTEEVKNNKSEENLEEVETSVLQEELLQLNEIRNNLLLDSNKTNKEKKNQFQEVEVSIKKYKEELERRGEETGTLNESINFEKIVKDAEQTETSKDKPEDEIETEPGIEVGEKDENHIEKEKHLKMNEAFRDWKNAQIDYEKKGNRLGIVERSLARMKIFLGNDAEAMKELYEAKKRIKETESAFKQAHSDFIQTRVESRKIALDHGMVNSEDKNELMRKYIFMEKVVDSEVVTDSGEKMVEKISPMQDLINKMLEINNARKEILNEREKGIIENLSAGYKKLSRKEKLVYGTLLAGVVGTVGSFVAGGAISTALGVGVSRMGMKVVRSLPGGALGAAAFRDVKNRTESTRDERKVKIEKKTIDNYFSKGGQLDMVSMVQKKMNIERNDNLKAMAAAGITGLVVGGGARAFLDWSDIPNFTSEIPNDSGNHTTTTRNVAEAASVSSPESSTERPDAIESLANIKNESFEDAINKLRLSGVKEPVLEEFERKFGPEAHAKFIEDHNGADDEILENFWENRVIDAKNKISEFGSFDVNESSDSQIINAKSGGSYPEGNNSKERAPENRFVETNNKIETAGFEDTEAFKKFQAEHSAAAHIKFVEGYDGTKIEANNAWIEHVRNDRDEYFKEASLEQIDEQFEAGGLKKTDAYKEFKLKYSEEAHNKFIEEHGGSSKETEGLWIKRIKAGGREYILRAKTETDSLPGAQIEHEKFFGNKLNEQTDDGGGVDSLSQGQKSSQLENQKEVLADAENSPKILTKEELSSRLVELKIKEGDVTWRAMSKMTLKQLDDFPKTEAEAVAAWKNNSLSLSPEVRQVLGTVDVREAGRMGRVAGIVYDEIDKTAIKKPGRIVLEDALKENYKPKIIKPVFLQENSDSLEGGVIAKEEGIDRLAPIGENGKIEARMDHWPKEKTPTVNFDVDDERFIEEGAPVSKKEEVGGDNVHREAKIKEVPEENKSEKPEEEVGEKPKKAAETNRESLGEVGVESEVEKTNPQVPEQLGDDIDESLMKVSEEEITTTFKDKKWSDFAKQIKVVVDDNEILKADSVEEKLFYLDHSRAMLLANEIRKETENIPGMEDCSVSERIIAYIKGGKTINKKLLKELSEFNEYIEKFDKK